MDRSCFSQPSAGLDTHTGSEPVTSIQEGFSAGVEMRILRVSPFEPSEVPGALRRGGLFGVLYPGAKKANAESSPGEMPS
jgi:hypothetical protein